MTIQARVRLASLLPLLTSFSIAACSGSSTPVTQSSGGTPAANGGASNGGAVSGGVSSGGAVATGGVQIGGAANPSNGGSATGGANAGGKSGTATGGATNPGNGGNATGGAPNPGNGGSATGGKAGAATGGVAAGGKGGVAAGAPATGGTANPGTGGAAAGASGSGYTENTGANCVATAAPMLSAKNPKLPDPFAMHDGTRITTKSQWECRRNEVKKDIEKYEIGTKPEPPTVAATLSGTTLSVKVTTSSGTITLTSTVAGSGSCVVIGMNSNSSLVSGCTQVPFKHDQVVQYANGGGSQFQSDPFYTVYPSLFGKVGNYAAWSWGISRLIDGLEQVKSQLNIDTTKIAVHGCSYAGKMALFGGAFDERVALTVAQESGGGGITSWRTSQDFATRTSTNVEKIDNTNYSWFLSSMKSLDPYSLPHDHHELIAMVAPRAIIALGNTGYEWLGDESGYKSITAAAEVFKAMGVPENIGYDFTGGHSHCAAATSQTAAVAAFVNKFLKGQTADTAIAVKPVATKYDLTYTNTWTTPTLQ